MLPNIGNDVILHKLTIFNTALATRLHCIGKTASPSSQTTITYNGVMVMVTVTVMVMVMVIVIVMAMIMMMMMVRVLVMMMVLANGDGSCTGPTLFANALRTCALEKPPRFCKFLTNSDSSSIFMEDVWGGDGDGDGDGAGSGEA